MPAGGRFVASSKSKTKKKTTTKHKERDTPDPRLIVDGQQIRKPSTAALAVLTDIESINEITLTPPENLPDVIEDIDCNYQDYLEYGPKSDNNNEDVIEASDMDSSPPPVACVTMKKPKKPIDLDKKDEEKAELKQCLFFLFISPPQVYN